MCGNTWWLRKVGAKLLSVLVIFLIFYSDIPLDFHEWIRAVAWKYLMCFLAGINTKSFWNTTEEKYIVPLRILYWFIKSLVSPFVDIDLNFFDSSFSLFSTSRYFVLFKITFLFKFFSLLLKSVSFTKLAISLFLAKFVSANLEAKFSDVLNVLNSWVVINLSWSLSVVILFSI